MEESFWKRLWTCRLTDYWWWWIVRTRDVISTLTKLTTWLCSQPVQFTLHIHAKLLLKVIQVTCSVHYLCLCLTNSAKLDEKRKLLIFLSIACFIFLLHPILLDQNIFLGAVFSVMFFSVRKNYIPAEKSSENISLLPKFLSQVFVRTHDNTSFWSEYEQGCQNFTYAYCKTRLI